jgi:hypothetical protein
MLTIPMGAIPRASEPIATNKRPRHAAATHRHWRDTISTAAMRSSVNDWRSECE